MAIREVKQMNYAMRTPIQRIEWQATFRNGSIVEQPQLQYVFTEETQRSTSGRSHGSCRRRPAEDIGADICR